ncbi:hypothetical protein J45TS6_35580 [Paenibacillus sp. J45TS6]|uniref:DUF4825 domain-containing protein n=1 Tax=Paenibacillus gallinarum TaxID=2762232 RepID=A0ABR8T663_9BACL|nr:MULTISPECIES: hypothetical protein [Paenibacillus]MBD7971253.1 hypothetical protein [Paenibacillus gallinarum]GIP45099.1 hypothetical protein J45TS6_35580 [Paenibacillus sp. J45TS6]
MKNKRRMLAIGISILFIFIVIFSVYSFQNNTSFPKLVSKQIQKEDINEIKISRIAYGTLYREEVIISESNEISSLINNLNNIELLEKYNEYIPRTEYRYDVLIQVNRQERFGITFLDEYNLEIYDAQDSNNRLNRYEIEDGYNLNRLADYFK